MHIGTTRLKGLTQARKQSAWLPAAGSPARGKGRVPRLEGSVRTRSGRALALLLLTGSTLQLAGCAALQPQIDTFCARHVTPLEDDAAFFQTAANQRAGHSEREVARLRADLDQAERILVTIESGLRSDHNRADAAAAILDSRTSLATARVRAPWRRVELGNARSQVTEAERQLRAGHTDSAFFFASRAGRIAADLNSEAAEVERNHDTLFVDAPRVNLRSGPSTQHRVVEVLGASTPVFPQRLEGEWLLVRTVTGPVGWVHSTLVRRQ